MADTPDTPLSLLERLRKKPGEESWRKLDDIYRKVLDRWVARHLPIQDGADLVQDVMVVLVRELPGFQHNGQPGAFRHWLWTILHNRLLKFFRDRARAGGNVQSMIEQLEEKDNPLVQSWEQEHNQYVLERLMNMIQREFEPASWQAFRRTMLQGKQPNVVAEELGITVNAVLIAKSRILRRLREEGNDFLDLGQDF